YGMLGTTFGGNHLACAAAVAVLEVIEQEQLIPNALQLGQYIMDQVRTFPHVKEVRGRGLMIGIELPEALAQVRKELLFTHRIFTGEARPNVIRLLPSLALQQQDADIFLQALHTVLKNS
ncbi:MAG TPA: aminotransferase class III-fold pyridoxal phosphate-dependent enzyme, partial [Chitinophaga sp.]